MDLSCVFWGFSAYCLTAVVVVVIAIIIFLVVNK